MPTIPRHQSRANNAAAPSTDALGDGHTPSAGIAKQGASSQQEFDPKRGRARASEAEGPDAFEQAVRRKQASIFSKTPISRLKKATTQLISSPAKMLPSAVREARVRGFSVGDAVNLLATPLTVYSAPIVAPLIALSHDRRPMFDLSTIQPDAFSAVGVVSSEGESRSIRRALRTSGALTSDNKIALRMTQEGFLAVVASQPAFVALGLSDKQKGDVERYLAITAQLSREPSEKLENLPRAARENFLALMDVTWTSTSRDMMKTLRKAGILDKDFLPRNASLLTEELFRRQLGEINFFLKSHGPVLRSFMDGQGNPLPPHEALRRLLFGEDLPRYDADRPPAYDG